MAAARSSSPLFKPASFKLSATIPARARRRPSFVRSASASSLPEDVKGPAHGRPETDDTAAIPAGSRDDIRLSPRETKPITIDIPRRERGAYTPLSARGELQGGYFPNHEDIQRSYRGHPFEPLYRPSSSPAMSKTPSPLSSPYERAPSPRSPYFPTGPYLQGPDVGIPRGKYYPSNYKKPSSTSSSPSQPSSPNPRPVHLSLPMTPVRPSTHQRRPSEVKQKLQQYQRQMIEQARLARENPSRHSTYTYGQASHSSPEGPKLVPVSPGGLRELSGITPLELEGDASHGYLGSGARHRGSFASVGSAQVASV